MRGQTVPQATARYKNIIVFIFSDYWPGCSSGDLPSKGAPAEQLSQEPEMLTSEQVAERSISLEESLAKSTESS